MGVALLTLTQNSSAQTIPVPELLFYRFNETGTSVTNEALTPPTNTNPATILGSLTQGSTGQCGGAIIGSGNSSSTDYVNTNWATDLTGTSWTISFWSKDVAPSSTLYYIFGDLNAGSFRCFTNGVAGPNNWILRGGLTDIYINGGATVAPHMNTFVYDMNLANIKAYLDGVLVSTVPQSGPTITGSGPFKIIGYGTNVGMSAGGQLDEFRVYNRAIDSAEVMLLYNLTQHDSASYTACDTAYTSPSGNYTWNSSGVYNDTLTNIYCGDSIVTIDLTLTTPSQNSLSPVICNNTVYTSPSGNYTWNATGIYTDTLPNYAGCDSVITINLTVNSANTTVTQGGYVLTASASGAAYQWIDCINNQPISGETGQSFTATANGSFAVIVTENGCTDTSSCYTIADMGVNDASLQKITAYPNPTNGNVQIQLGNTYEQITVEVINSLGQVIQTRTYTDSNQLSVYIDGAAGLYMLRVTTPGIRSKMLNILKY